MAVEAYHASEIRLLCYQLGLADKTDKISAVRAALSGAADDQGVTLDGSVNGLSNIVPTDSIVWRFHAVRVKFSILSKVPLTLQAACSFRPTLTASTRFPKKCCAFRQSAALPCFWRVSNTCTCCPASCGLRIVNRPGDATTSSRKRELWRRP
jgi:hypothetical protein